MRKSRFLMLKALKSAPHPNDNLLMCEMLWEPIVAIDWEEHASETAVRYSSLSAASWALRFFPMYAGRVFCVSRFTFIAELKR